LLSTGFQALGYMLATANLVFRFLWRDRHPPKLSALFASGRFGDERSCAKCYSTIVGCGEQVAG
jgi:hypothetical protein